MEVAVEGKEVEVVAVEQLRRRIALAPPLRGKVYIGILIRTLFSNPPYQHDNQTLTKQGMLPPTLLPHLMLY